jgi:hypothetical protein
MRDGKRELLIGGVSLVRGTVRNAGKAMVAACDGLEAGFEQTAFLGDAPFKVVSIILRFGTEWGEPDLGRVNKRHSELEAGIELPLAEIRMMDESALSGVFRNAALKILVAVADKYELDGSYWKEQLVK